MFHVAATRRRLQSDAPVTLASLCSLWWFPLRFSFLRFNLQSHFALWFIFRKLSSGCKKLAMFSWKILQEAFGYEIASSEWQTCTDKNNVRWMLRYISAVWTCNDDTDQENSCAHSTIWCAKVSRRRWSTQRTTAGRWFVCLSRVTSCHVPVSHSAVTDEVSVTELLACVIADRPFARNELWAFRHYGGFQIGRWSAFAIYSR